MKPAECGFARPPADGTPAREAVDRFVDFLAAVGGPASRETIDRLSPARRYHVRLLAWRLSQPVVS